MKLRKLEEVIEFSETQKNYTLSQWSVIRFLPPMEYKKLVEKHGLETVHGWAILESESTSDIYEAYTLKNVIATMRRYVDKAWENANYPNGSKIMMYLAAYSNWFYMIDDTNTRKLANMLAVANSKFKGKDYLWVITKILDLDPEDYDNNIWYSSIHVDGVPANSNEAQDAILRIEQELYMVKLIEKFHNKIIEFNIQAFCYTQSK